MSAREIDVARGMALVNNFEESIDEVLLSSTVKASIRIKQLELLSRFIPLFGGPLERLIMSPTDAVKYWRKEVCKRFSALAPAGQSISSRPQRDCMGLLT